MTGSMTSAVTRAADNGRAIEYAIIRDRLRRGSRAGAEGPHPGVAERLIRVLAATAGLFLLGAWLQELLWVAIGAATVLSLGAGGR